MTKMKWVLAGILLTACSAMAQETPKAEISAGYSYLRLGGSGGVNQNGTSFSIAGNLNHWLGIVGDVGIYHAAPFGVGLNTTTFLVGPRMSFRYSRVTPFVQVLFGGAHLAAGLNGLSASLTPYTFSAGGGVDVKISSHVALRPQVDYIAMTSGGQTTKSARASFGIVFRFGAR
jgi:outer membrane protein with beta-barrel domain